MLTVSAHMHNHKTHQAPTHPLKERRNTGKTLSILEKKPATKYLPAKKAKTQRPQDNFVDKENRVVSEQQIESKPVPGYLKATVSSRKKVDSDDDWKITMEKELAGLQGAFAAMKRESLRASVGGTGSHTEDRTACIVPQSPAGSSLAARLQALKRESSQPLEGKASADVRPSQASGKFQQAIGQLAKALLPTTRDNIQAGLDHRTSFSDIISFEAAGQWETPSLAQVAEELFSDSAFAEMCERGLTMQLKRTKDGATAESRIAELAGEPIVAPLL